MMKKAALVISLCVFSIGSFSQKKNNLKKPNIIYILADDLVMWSYMPLYRLLVNATPHAFTQNTNKGEKRSFLL